MKWHQRFFWLLLLFLPTQLGYHFWPEWAMVLGRRVDYLAPTVYLTDILVFLILFFWLLDVISKIKNKKSKIQIKYQKLLTPSAMLLFIFLNVAVAANPYVAMYKWLKVVEFALLGWYIVKTRPKLSFIITPLSIGVLYSSIIAITQFELQHSIGGPLWWLGERTFDADTPGIARIALHWSLGFGYWDFGLKLRPYATFPHPNVLGGFLAAVLPLVISNFQFSIFNQTKKFSMFKIITVIFGVIALFLSFSRSAIVVGLFAIVLVLYQKIMIKNKKLKIISYLIVGSALIFIFNSQFSILNSQDESIVVRQQLNAAAIKLWQSSPLFGVGLGNFLVRLPETLPTRTIYFLQPVHNIYLLVLVETGVVGLLGFTWILWKALRGKQESKIRALRLSLYAFLLFGLVDHYPATLQQGQLLLTIVASMSMVYNSRLHDLFKRTSLASQSK